MVHTSQVAAAAAVDSSSGSRAPRPGRGNKRSTSIGSFRAGSPLPTLQSPSSSRTARRQSTHHRYHTFPTSPPKTPGRRPNIDFAASDTSSIRPTSPHLSDPFHRDEHHGSTPLPWEQLGLLAILSLAEQTALNSISPYLPDMVKSFPGMDEEQVGLYVGLLASAFALAQLTTNLLWGYVSDIIGRKPVMLMGTSLLCICFAFFGFCTRYWHVVSVHVAMGLLNGNAAVVPTCLGELTDRSNQSKGFTWLPVVYSLGSITGPALGGVLVGTVEPSRYPFLAPNILGALLLALSVIVLALWFEETLEERGDGFDWSSKFTWLCCCMRRTKNSLKHTWHNPFSNDGAAEELGDEAGEERGLLTPTVEENEDDPKGPTNPDTWRQIFNRTTIMLLISYLFFQVSNISFSSLYPLFASGPEPTGRELHPDVIGISLSFAGVFTILFQLFLFRPLKTRLGNLGTYRGSLLGFAICMALMPFVGYADSKPPFGLGSGKIWLFVEMGAVLVIKNICAVGGLSSVMLLITNSAPSHASLGTVNGIAQTLSALGRSIGPFVSGGLFTLSVHVQPMGEALAWGVFGCVALAGWLGSYLIHGQGLESTDDGFGEDESGTDDETLQDAP